MKWGKEAMQIYKNFEEQKVKVSLTGLKREMNKRGLLYNNNREPGMAYSLLDYPLPDLGMVFWSCC